MSEQTAQPNSKRALLNAFDEVLKMQAEQRAEEAAARSTGRASAATWLSVVLLLLTATYLGLARPDWLFPPAPPMESPALKEASLRIALANAARHVEYFRRQHGRLPATLEETGTVAHGIVYERAGDQYKLHGLNGKLRLTLSSTEPLLAFIGNSFDVISRRSR